MKQGLSVRRFNIHEADWPSEGRMLLQIRRLVLVIEQNLAREDESDRLDEESWHWLATDAQDVPIGAVRLVPTGEIGRLAVLEKHRGAGVGAALLEQAIDKAKRLGFSRLSVTVEADSRDFYGRAGFAVIEKEYAGTTFRMEQTLPPLDDKVQRLTASDFDSSMSVKEFDTREASFKDVSKIIKKVRQIVFIQQFGLPELLAGDEFDAQAIHWVAEDNTRQIIGVIRMSADGVISHLAIMPEHRCKGIGQSLLELAVAKATRFDLEEVKFDAPAEMESFFDRAGFKKRIDSFELFGLTLHSYFKKTVLEDVHIPLQKSVSGDHYSESEVIYKLGQDNKLILLRREEDYRNVILEMAKQAITSIRILSPLLEHKLYDNNELREILSALARKNRHTHIEILLYDSHRLTSSGHTLLEISRKLSSSIRMKMVHPELRYLNHEYMLVDDTGVVYRLDHEVFDGYANFSDKAECSRLGRQFTAAWESGLDDPNLRRLRM